MDYLENIDFGPLHGDLAALLSALSALPAETMPHSEQEFHMYWGTRDFGRKPFLAVKSFLATQPRCYHLNVWTTQVDQIKSLVDKLPGAERISVRRYIAQEEARGTALAGTPWVTETLEPRVTSDILRHVVLFKYGGVYVDMDTVLLRPFEPLLSREFMFRWGRDVGMISSAVMYLKQASEVAELAMCLIRELPTWLPGGAWVSPLARHLFNLNPTAFRVLPCGMFDPEWAMGYPLTPMIVHERSADFYPGSFAWHWHNKWDATIGPGSKWDLMEKRIHNKLLFL
jgi:hypothetical protein